MSTFYQPHQGDDEIDDEKEWQKLSMTDQTVIFHT